MRSLSKNTLQWLRFNIATPRELRLDLDTRGIIFYVFGFANVIFQINNEKQCCINNGHSLHHEFYNLILEIVGLFTSDVHKLLKYLKLVQIAMVQVIGFVEDKVCFSNLNFIKFKFHNWLTTHLKLVVWMFAQQFYM